MNETLIMTIINRECKRKVIVRNDTGKRSIGTTRRIHYRMSYFALRRASMMLKRYIYWKGVRQDVQAYVNNCAGRGDQTRSKDNSQRREVIHIVTE